MDDFNPVQQMSVIAEHIVLTPAERAMLTEQAETARLELAELITLCANGDSAGAIKKYVDIAYACEGMNQLIQLKVRQQVIRMMGEDQ